MIALLQIVDAASTPLLAVLCWIVWRIKTNDLHKIEMRLSYIEGAMTEHDRWEKNLHERP